MRPEDIPLREAILSGRHTRPDRTEVAEVAARLGRFLAEPRGALASWFGAGPAAALRRDPQRLRGLVDRDLARLDALIAAQLDAVLHHPRLQRLEGSWRGLAWMLAGIGQAAPVRVRLLSARWEELARDFDRAGDFDRSALFRLVYENEFGHAGGEPFGLLVIDHEVRHLPERREAGAAAPVDDVSVLAELAAVGAAAFAPMVLAAAPSLLGVDRFEDLALAQDVTAVLADADHARWRALARREEARFLCVTLPRVLARPRHDHAAGFAYAEHAPSARERSWFSAGYAFAATVARAQALHGWPADVRGIVPDRVGGGLVRGLPEEDVVLGAATRWPRPALDLALTDRQERDLVLAGLMPLNTLPYGEAGFAAVQSLQARADPAPGRPMTAAIANQRLSAQINSMLCVSRFAHYVKIIGRELSGAFMTAGEIERRLQSWLSGYTNASQTPDADSRARHPLVASRVSVQEHADRPGAFACVIHLQPYYQLDDVATSFRLVTGFAATGRAA
ncbi:Type VI secretion system contractile sheath large subunit [Rhodovastum atsumiense]|uniref:Type VI secretion system contractile sheath large subunit n=1 Tax=Rhodovastum atsumiense TaxID=504468 RepID=A0A5M6IZE5_9PROT|nr:type VI secretion system contractile sheath large subunit [Rhodovastum atsumiense]KAA5612728.1 type VI secretion system contractile sheath large subunit [Rhodovastum atsumiense]CAH2602715.1 Type VI secretion system contractile sheath large subunit [Rhodovastum atsumiense]